MSNPKIIGNAVANLYNIYPFPPETLLNEIPPGYNWRWHWTSAYNFCTGEKPSNYNIRICYEFKILIKFYVRQS